MKKHYFVIAMLAAATAMNAQTINRTSFKYQTIEPTFIGKTLEKVLLGGGIDTILLQPASLNQTCGQQFTVYPIDRVAPNDTGYILGTNKLGDKEKAQKYTIKGNASVIAVGVLYGVRSNSSGSTSVKLYGVNATTKAPNNNQVLGTSASIMVKNLSKSGVTFYPFAAPVPVNNISFVASAVLPTSTTDTVAIASTVVGCSSTDTLAWEKWSDNSWHSIKASWGGNANDLDILIVPVVTTPSGIGSISKNGLALNASAYPNPANSTITVGYSLETAEKVTIEAYDMNGKQVSTFVNNQLKTAGKHESVLDISSLTAGTYFYSVSTGSSRLMGKFSVVK